MNAWTGKKDIQTVHWDKPKKTAFVERWLLLEVGLYWLLTLNQILERRKKGYIKARVTNRFA